MAKTFVYKARDRSGQVLTGNIIAESEAAVAAYIRDKGYFVTQIKVQKQASSLRALVNSLKRVTIKDLAVFCRQFSIMVDAGLSLVACLNILIDQTYNPKLKVTVQDIYKKVQEGETLSRAMRTIRTYYPKL